MTQTFTWATYKPTTPLKYFAPGTQLSGKKLKKYRGRLPYGLIVRNYGESEPLMLTAGNEWVDAGDRTVDIDFESFCDDDNLIVVYCPEVEVY